MFERWEEEVSVWRESRKQGEIEKYIPERKDRIIRMNKQTWLMIKHLIGLRWNSEDPLKETAGSVESLLCLFYVVYVEGKISNKQD